MSGNDHLRKNGAEISIRILFLPNDPSIKQMDIPCALLNHIGLALESFSIDYTAEVSHLGRKITLDNGTD